MNWSDRELKALVVGMQIGGGFHRVDRDAAGAVRKIDGDFPFVMVEEVGAWQS